MSRFRPISELYQAVHCTYDVPAYGYSFAYHTVYTDMIAYDSNIPHPTCCIVITERIILKRTPIKIYRCPTGIAPKYALDPSYKVNFYKNMSQLGRGKPIQLVKSNEQDSLRQVYR